MEIPLYNGIKYYLRQNCQKLPKNVTEELKRKILVQHQDYVIQEKEECLILYFKDKDGTLKEEIRSDELEEILEEGHKGHFGVQAAYDKLQPKYHFPHMWKTIKDYVESCRQCQLRKKPRPNEPLHSIKASKPFELVGMDCIGPLKETPDGNKYIITMTDYFTKWVEARAVKDIKATTITKFIFEEVITRHGVPERILTDRGTSFRNELVESLCEVMGTRHSYTSAYHPQTNGLTEKFNGTLCNMLAKFVDEQGGSWDTWIPAALMCYRNKVHSSTKFTPALLRYGHNLETPFTLKRKSRDLNEPEGNVTPQDYVELLSNHHKRIYEIAKQNQDKAHEQQKKSYDKKIKQVSYKIGDKVLLYDSAKQNTKGDKFKKIYKGPYYIRDTNTNGTYKLQHCETNEIQKDINGKRLKEFIDRPLWEPLITIEDDDERIKNLEDKIQQEKELRETGQRRIGDKIRDEAIKEMQQITRLEQQIKRRIQDRERTKQDKETQMRKLAQDVIKRQDKLVDKRVRDMQTKIRTGQYLAQPQDDSETILIFNID